MSAEDGLGVVGSGVAVPGQRRRKRFSAGLVAVLMLVGSVPGAVVSWALRRTWEAGKGAGSPTAAVFGVMSGVDRWADEELVGVGRYMSSAHRDEVRARVLELRRQLVVQPHGADLELSQAQVVMLSDDRATVTVQVRATTQFDGGFIHGEWHPWTFETVNEYGFSSGWKVDAINGPDLCGTHLRCSAKLGSGGWRSRIGVLALMSVIRR